MHSPYWNNLKASTLYKCLTLCETLRLNPAIWLIFSFLHIKNSQLLLERVITLTASSWEKSNLVKLFKINNHPVCLVLFSCSPSPSLPSLHSPSQHQEQKGNQTKAGLQKIASKKKTYNSRYSLMVTHSTTNLPI